MKKLTIYQIEKFYYELESAEMPSSEAKRYKENALDYLSLLHREMEDRNIKSLKLKERSNDGDHGNRTNND